MCQFLVGNNGLFSLSKTHQYYTGFVSQMGITGIHYCYIFVWTMKDLSVKKITFNKKFWYYVKTNSDIFVNHLSAQYFWGTNQLHIVLAVTKYDLKSEK